MQIHDSRQNLVLNSSWTWQPLMMYPSPHRSLKKTSTTSVPNHNRNRCFRLRMSLHPVSMSFIWSGTPEGVKEREWARERDTLWRGCILGSRLHRESLGTESRIKESRHQWAHPVSYWEVERQTDCHIHRGMRNRDDVMTENNTHVSHDPPGRAASCR